MKKVIAYVHSHWDREWYREFEEFRLRLIEVFDEVLNALDNGELPCFYFDGQTAALEDYLEIYPEKTEQIKNLVKAKKLRIGPFYCSTDSFLVSGECLCRNLEMGIKKSKEFGEDNFIGYFCDSFGHSQCVPYVLKHFNIDKACFWRGLGDNYADLDWQGIDVTYLIQGYFQDFLNCDWPINKKAEAIKKYLDKISLKSSENVLLPIGADHLTIAKNIEEQFKEMNLADYSFELATPFEYFDKITKRKAITGEFLDNKLNFILAGVYSSRIYIKQANADAQWLLTRIAEPLQALSNYHFGTKNKQKEINYAYKLLIQNQAHDSIYGCSTDIVHDEMMTRYAKINSVSNGIIKRVIRDLSNENGSVSVINLSNFEYNGKIKITTEKKLPKWMNAVKISSKKGFSDKKLYNINSIPVTEDITNINDYLIDVQNIPAFSITQIKKEHICNEKHLKTSENSIENKFIKFEVKNNKITVTDKIRNEKYNDFISITDRKDVGDSYNFGALKGDKPIKATLKKVKLKEKNSQRAILTLTFDMLKIDVILYNQSEYIEFDANWINKKKNHILQIGFKLKEKITSTISEDLFGTVKRSFNPDYDIYKDIPAPRGIELKPNTAPMQRFVQAQNFGMITKGNNEYEIIKNTLNLTLLRATGTISNPKNPTRGTPAGPPLDTPKLQCLGQNKANFAICFSNDLFRLAEEFYNPHLSLFTNIKDKKLVETKNIIYSIQSKKKGIQIRTFDECKKMIESIDFNMF